MTNDNCILVIVSSLEASQKAFLQLRGIANSYKKDAAVSQKYQKRVHERFNDGLDTLTSPKMPYESPASRNIATGQKSKSAVEKTKMHARMKLREKRRVSEFFGAEDSTQKRLWEILKKDLSTASTITKRLRTRGVFLFLHKHAKLFS
jgi:hypothetical protein